MTTKQKCFLWVASGLWIPVWITRSFNMPLFRPLVMTFLFLLAMNSLIIFVGNRTVRTFTLFASYVCILVGDFFLNFTPLSFSCEGFEQLDIL